MAQKEVYFSIAEKQWIECLRDMGMNLIEANEVVIRYKREMAYMHQQQGNLPLWEQLLKELGEWDDSMKDTVKINGQEEVKLIIPE